MGLHPFLGPGFLYARSSCAITSDSRLSDRDYDLPKSLRAPEFDLFANSIR